ncbi:MAG TPA: flagellar motor protein MotB [Opitutaceae bacterium]|nr:flagellar motor protein MotB [Opitutaceae bacterium]HND62235.1 flagellar motor protein MotB [Opitutaceae bacterium]
MSGGAWKVAYADFVTAMMALFMVLWISAQDQKILIATSEYFQNPFHSPVNATSGVLPFNSKQTTHSEGREQGNEKETDRNKHIEMTFLNTVAADFYRLLHLDENLADKPIDIQVTSDGLRITLFDRARRPLFKEDSTEFTEWGRFIMQNLAWMIDRHHFRVTIDGHTRAPVKLVGDDDRGWELSAARANASRRLLVYYAVESDLIERVTGYASTKPLPNEKPTAESNQRVTLSLALGSKAREDKKEPAPAAPAVPAPAAGSVAVISDPHAAPVSKP